MQRHLTNRGSVRLVVIIVRRPIRLALGGGPGETLHGQSQLRALVVCEPLRRVILVEYHRAPVDTLTRLPRQNKRGERRERVTRLHRPRLYRRSERETKHRYPRKWKSREILKRITTNQF